MGEELAEHEGVVGLGMVLWQTNILVHVEGHDMLKSERNIQISVPWSMNSYTKLRTKASYPLRA